MKDSKGAADAAERLPAVLVISHEMSIPDVFAI